MICSVKTEEQHDFSPTTKHLLLNYAICLQVEIYIFLKFENRLFEEVRHLKIRASPDVWNLNQH